MRGMYTAGALDVFMDAGIQFDGILGVSAGAAFGVNYLSGQRGRTIRYNKRFNGDKRYMGVSSLLKTGDIINAEFAYYTVPQTLDIFDDDAFMASPVPFYAVVTNIVSGKPEYVRIRSVFQQMETLRASASMPFVSKPVMLDGTPYLDGGISDSIPYQAFSRMGYDKLAVILTRESSYVKKPISSRLVSAFYKDYPALQKLLLSRHTRYNEQVAELQRWETQGKAFVLRPTQSIKIKKVEKDPQRLQEVYDLGTQDAKKNLSALRDYLQQDNA